VWCRAYIAESLMRNLHASRKNAKEMFAMIESYEIAQTSLAAAENSERYVNPPLLKRSHLNKTTSYFSTTFDTCLRIFSRAEARRV